MQHMKYQRIKATIGALVAFACAARGGSDSSAGSITTQPLPDTTLAGAYAAVLHVAWDSVLAPYFREVRRLPVVVWDSSVAGPLMPGHAKVPQAVLELLTASGLADGTCPSRNPNDCGFVSPLVRLALVTLERRPDGSVAGGFMEFLVEENSSPRLDGTTWFVTLHLGAQGWIVVSAKMVAYS